MPQLTDGLIENAFQFAGFSGRPTEVPTDVLDGMELDFARLIALFDGQNIRELAAEAGWTQQSAENPAGLVFGFAANILEKATAAGLTPTGRDINTTGLTVAGLNLTFVTAAEYVATSRLRVRDLRAIARNRGVAAPASTAVPETPVNPPQVTGDGTDETARDAAAAAQTTADRAEGKADANTTSIARVDGEVQANARNIAGNAQLAGAVRTSLNELTQTISDDYRTAAEQDAIERQPSEFERDQAIVNDRATAGITLARQEAATADGKAVAAQEHSENTRAASVMRDTALGERIDAEVTLRTAADTVLGERIDELGNEFLVSPDVWIKSNDARTLTIHLVDSDVPDDVGFLRLNVTGISRLITARFVANQQDYDFPIPEAEATRITSAAEQHITVSLEFIHTGGGRTLITRTRQLRAIAPSSDLDTIAAINRNTGAIADNAAAITALDEKATTLESDFSQAIDALENDYLVSPDYWLRTGDARNTIVHLLHSELPAGAAKLRLTIRGVSKTVNVVANETDYTFAFTAADGANILRNLRTDTILRSELEILDSSDAVLVSRARAIRVLAEAPSTGGSSPAAGGVNKSYVYLATVNSSSGFRVDDAIDALTLRITPSDASKKILVTLSVSEARHPQTSSMQRKGISGRFFRDTTTIQSLFDTYVNMAGDAALPAHAVYLDSPNTASEVQYQFGITHRRGGGTATLNRIFVSVEEVD